MSPEPGRVVVDQVWKRFRKDRGRKLLRDQVTRLGHLARRTDGDPWRWVLRDIGFEVEPGESLAIVGVNGSGKSTLLKIIAGVMFPYAGHVETTGRIGALIEVMSGIHPDLTGRENVYVYATLLGLSRKQVADKFDEIVAFAEVEDAVDRQVKFYSSGMKMRIGFAIAAFLEPSVLIVDEVLAVGDSSFQQKCLTRMSEVTKSGTTLLLVSHDLAAVAATASRGVWLGDARVQAAGPIDEVLAKYRTHIEERAAAGASQGGPVRVRNVRVQGPTSSLVSTNEPCVVTLEVESDERHNVNLYLGASEGAPTPIFVVRREVTLEPGVTRLRLELPRLPLPAGKFFLWAGAFRVQTRHELMPWHPVASLPVVGRHRLDPTPGSIVRLSPVFVESSWTVDRSAGPSPAPEPRPEVATPVSAPEVPVPAEPVPESAPTVVPDVAVAGVAEPAPSPPARVAAGAVRPTEARKVSIVRPVSFADAPRIGDRLRERRPVIVDLRGLEPRLARRLIDFANGIAYGSDGTMAAAGDQRFLLTPDPPDGSGLPAGEQLDRF